VFQEYDEEMLVLLVSDRPRLLATKWQVPFGVPKYEVFGARLGESDLFDTDRQRVVFEFLVHTSGSSNFYRIQEDL
jgi:hypothetical protein